MNANERAFPAKGAVALAAVAAIAAALAACGTLAYFTDTEYSASSVAVEIPAAVTYAVDPAGAEEGTTDAPAVSDGESLSVGDGQDSDEPIDEQTVALDASGQGAGSDDGQSDEQQ